MIHVTAPYSDNGATEVLLQVKHRLTAYEFACCWLLSQDIQEGRTVTTIEARAWRASKRSVLDDVKHQLQFCGNSTDLGNDGVAQLETVDKIIHVFSERFGIKEGTS